MKMRDRLLRPLLEPQFSPLLVLLAAILLGIVGNATYDLVKGWWGTEEAALVFGLVALLVIVVGYWVLRMVRRSGYVEGVVAPRRGLVVLVSTGETADTPAFAAVQHHLGANGQAGRLEMCYLIAGRRAADPDQEPPSSSWSNAVALRSQLEERGKRAEIIEVEAQDCEDVMRGVEGAWQRARSRDRLPRGEIVADLTGGTKQMSIGMSLACMKHGCDMEYLYPKEGCEPACEPRWVSLWFYTRTPADDPAD